MAFRFRLALLATASVCAVLGYLAAGKSTPVLMSLLALGGLGVVLAAAEWFVLRPVQVEPTDLAKAARGAALSLEPAPLPAEQFIALRKIRLAKEYAAGITLLVDVATAHQTPLPHAALKNLRYLLCLLDQAEDAMSPGISETAQTPCTIEQSTMPAPARHA